MLGLWFVMLLMAIWQIPLLYKKKQFKELLSFIGIWLTASIYASLVVSEIKLISPFVIITNIVKIIFE